MDPTLYFASIALVLVVIVAIGFWLRASLVRSLHERSADPSLSLLQNQVAAGNQQSVQQVQALQKNLQDALQALNNQVATALSESNRTVGDRLDNTTKVIGDVRQQLGLLEQSSKRLMELGKDIAKLEDILQPPKLRGALGELFLADLLSQVLPAGHYRLQHHFKGGEAVDAVVLLRSGMVPIDAKFPLDNIRRVLASDTEEARRAAKRAFVRDVKGHIDAIASKYIRMDEGTFDFALMYIPAENVYYETLIRDDAFGGEMSLFHYALKQRVIPVSPHTFYAYLQTIILGLKGMQVEEQSRRVIEYLSRLRKEFDAFSTAFRLVGQHLDNSQKKYAEAEKRFGRVESKVEQLNGLTGGIDPAIGTPGSEADAVSLPPQSPATAPE